MVCYCVPQYFTVFCKVLRCFPVIYGVLLCSIVSYSVPWCRTALYQEVVQLPGCTVFYRVRRCSTVFWAMHGPVLTTLENGRWKPKRFEERKQVLLNCFKFLFSPLWRTFSARRFLLLKRVIPGYLDNVTVYTNHKFDSFVQENSILIHL